jgi:hypothetical protein
MSDLVGKLRRAGAFAYGSKAEESLFWKAADRIKELEAHITTDNSAVIATLENRIALLEAHLQQMRSGTDLPFPAVTDRHLIEAAIDNGRRIATLEAAIREHKKATWSGRNLTAPHDQKLYDALAALLQEQGE